MIMAVKGETMKKVITWATVLLLFVSSGVLAEHRSTYSTNAVRDKNGKIARSAKARREFREKNPCPATGKTAGTCPGYVIDHIIPLKRGGADDPENMQWQKMEEAKRKDLTE